jgi:hypothetical protein
MGVAAAHDFAMLPCAGAGRVAFAAAGDDRTPTGSM